MGCTSTAFIEVETSRAITSGAVSSVVYGYTPGYYGAGTAWGQAYNPRTGTRAAGYRSANAYSSWGRGVELEPRPGSRRE